MLCRHLREFLAELLGTFVLVLMGDGAVAQWALSASPGSSGNKVTLLVNWSQPMRAEHVIALTLVSIAPVSSAGRHLPERVPGLRAGPDGGHLRVRGGLRRPPQPRRHPRHGGHQEVTLGAGSAQCALWCTTGAGVGIRSRPVPGTLHGVHHGAQLVLMSVYIAGQYLVLYMVGIMVVQVPVLYLVLYTVYSTMHF